MLLVQRVRGWWRNYGRSNHTFEWLIIGVAYWLIAICYVIDGAMQPPGCAKARSTASLIERLWIEKFECLEPNAIGDFLAGVIAPVAFAGLASALLVQSRELAAQRKELVLTRQEFQLNRLVAQQQADATTAQAEESKRSAEYFALQADALLDERRDATESLALAELNERISEVFTVADQASNARLYLQSPSAQVSASVGFRSPENPDRRQVADALHQLTERLNALSDQYSQGWPLGRAGDTSPGQIKYLRQKSKEIAVATLRANDASKEVRSEYNKDYAGRLRLQELADAATEFEKVMETYVTNDL